MSAEYSADAYDQRAQECARLANLAQDDLIQRELLKLRQTYLEIARRLHNLGIVRDIATNPHDQ
jgi:hypothetical protein